MSECGPTTKATYSQRMTRIPLTVDLTALTDGQKERHFRELGPGPSNSLSQGGSWMFSDTFCQW